MGFKFENNTCLSLCPDGTYYDSILNECTICDSNKCTECIKTATTCTKCSNELALDITTFTCKPCCSRSIYGKVSKISCCVCPLQFNGYCSYKNQTNGNVLFDNDYESFINSKKNLSFYVFFAFLIILAFILCISSFIMIRPLFIKNKKYGTILYSALEDSN